jgi:hypothetical protein
MRNLDLSVEYVRGLSLQTSHRIIRESLLSYGSYH